MFHNYPFISDNFAGLYRIMPIKSQDYVYEMWSYKVIAKR